MLIVLSSIVDKYTKSVHLGKFIDLSRMRDDLAQKYKADKTYPFTTGIFLRIIPDAPYEEYKVGA